MCRDYFEDGCGRTFVNSSQLNVHVRKVHKGIILHFLVEVADCNCVFLESIYKNF